MSKFTLPRNSETKLAFRKYRIGQFTLKLFETKKNTVCPGSSDPPEKNILVYLLQKIRLTPFFTITIF